MKIGFMFQFFHLLPRATALRCAELPLVYAGVGSRARPERAECALERVEVQIGVSDGLMTEVLEGLSEGDRVVLPPERPWGMG
ncbi:MAG: hypothetical protein V2A76_10185 [Planctomycetota bacterium]